ncbi:MAG TPA: hypothetical protein VHM90_07720 [Phycisphaerae bacterium]|nr:hypothetical protein [Phycisphaerae bacterium]
MPSPQTRRFSAALATLALLAGGCKDSTHEVQASEDAVPAPQTVPAQFRIFDTTLYRNKPAAVGMSREMQIIYPNFMARDFEGKLRGLYPGTKDPDLKLLLDQAAGQGATHILFDVESAYGTDPSVEASMQRLVKTARAYKPQLQYGCCYLPATYPAGSAHQGTVAQVQASNNSLASTIQLMDFLVPEAYLHDDPGKGRQGHAAWLKYLNLGIAEAKRLAPGKPVFPLLEVCIADYGWAGPMTAKGPLPPDLLADQVRAALIASGGNVIIWGATRTGENGQFADWDPNESWYTTLLKARLLKLGPSAQEELDHGSPEMAVQKNARFPGK